MQVLNLNKDKIDITKIKNARFLYNPVKKELILDDDNKLSGSHSELYFNIKNTNDNFDDYIRGFIGFGGNYRNGIIHFSPHIMKQDYEGINAGLSFIEQMIKMGATDKIKIRNLGYIGEIKYYDLISDKILNENFQDTRSEKEKFNAWFYGSKVIDDHKQPLSVYKLNENKYTSNMWLAKIQNKNNIKKSFLRIENPYIVKDSLTESIKELKKKGYDGIIENDTYIIFDNFQVKDLKEANAQNDNKIRNALEDIFDEIQYNMKEGKYNTVKSTPIGFGVVFIISDIIKQFIPTFKNKKIFILITEMSEDALAFYKNNTESLGGIYMYILPDKTMNKLAMYHTNNELNKLQKVIKEEVWAYFMHNKEAFIHELTHAVDFSRLKNYKSKHINQYNLSNEEYLSNPLEFNAWFTAKISQYNDILHMLPQFKNSWNEFYNYILDEFDFIKHYNTKYRRKFDKRLYQYWKENIHQKNIKEGYVQRKSKFGNTGIEFDDDYIEFEVGMSYVDENNIKWTIEAVKKDNDGEEMCRVVNEDGKTDIISSLILNIDLFDLNKKHMIYDERFFNNNDINRTNEIINEEKVIAYHGGEKGIKSFNLQKTEYGMFFFTNSKDLAKSYLGYNDSNLDNQQIYTVELNIDNPLNLRNKESLALFAKSLHPNMPSLEKEWLAHEEEYWNKYIKNEHDVAWFLGNLAILHREEIKKYAINNNYDAIYNYEPTPDGRFNENWLGYIVFNPKKIKIINKENISETLVYAGSPTDYEKPSLVAINSGEGNQAHGWGLYYAVNKEVAQSYAKHSSAKKSLSYQDKIIDTSNGFKIDGHQITEKNNPALFTIIAYSTINGIKSGIEQLQFFINNNREYIKNNPDGKYVKEKKKDILMMQKAIKLAKDLKEKKGVVHEVEIPDDEYFINEQKTFNQQSKYVKEKYKQIVEYLNGDLNEIINSEGYTGKTKAKGKDLYDSIKQLIIINKNKSDDYGFNSAKAASMLLLKFGIKGIKYNGNQDGICYVIFNPKDVKVLKKHMVESLQKIETNETPIYVTNSVYDILNLSNKIPSMRVLIDESKNLYIAGNALYFIHSSLFDEAINSGYYEFSSKEEKDLYWESLPAIIIDQNDYFWLDRKNDYFEEMLNYGNFVVYYRTDDFLDTKFYKVLNMKYKLKNKQNLNEEVYTVYHGSSQSFDAFSYDFIGKGNDEKGPGFYFTSKKEDAQMYGKVGEYQITLDKLVSTKKRASIEVIEKIIALSENCQTIDELVEKYENDEDLWWDSNLSNYAEDPYSAVQIAIDLVRQQPTEYKAFMDLWSGVYHYDNKKFLQAVSSLGYDGIIFNVADDTTHYIVYNPNKIKKIKEIVNEGKVVASDYGKFIINPNYEQCANIINNYNFDLRILYDPQINVMIMGNANTTLHWYMFLFLWQQGMYPDFGRPVENINKAADKIQDYYDYKTCQFVLSKDYTDDWNSESTKDDLNAYDDYIIGEDFITYFRSRNKALLSKTRLWDNINKHAISPELTMAAESVNLLESTYNQVLDNPFGYLPKDEESVKKVKKFIQLYGNKYQNNQVKFYHATNADYDIENQGLLPTSKNRRNSYQSGSGYVYLANTPEQAKEFADFAFPRNNIAIYEVNVYFNQMLPNKDQIRNQRLYAGKEELKDTLANSIVFGGGIRVKGKIPSYQIHLLKVIKRKSIGKLTD